MRPRLAWGLACCACAVFTAHSVVDVWLYWDWEAVAFIGDMIISVPSLAVPVLTEPAVQWQIGMPFVVLLGLVATMICLFRAIEPRPKRTHD